MRFFWPLVLTVLCLVGGIVLLGSTPSISAAAPILTGHNVAYIGCSNTRMSAVGYYATAGNHAILWNSALTNYDIDGGRIELWADPQSTYWQQFDAQVGNWYGQPTKVWVQLCEKYDTNPTDYAHVRALFANLKQHAPQAVYYVSAINVYNPITLCAWMGPNGQGVTDTEKWRDQAVADGLALRGPDMGPLDATTTYNEHCHPNTAGEALLGGELFKFFDSTSPPPTATPTPCNVKPARPTLVSPKNGATINSKQVSLDWTEDNCAKSYTVVVRLGSSSGPVVERVGNLTASPFTTQPLTPGQLYYWRVKACDSAGCTSTRWRHFTVSATAGSAPGTASAMIFGWPSHEPGFC